jgi:cytochrome oxidase Cu insertion factor (SCO1/SenC/PrrC family)
VGVAGLGLTGWLPGIVFTDWNWITPDPVGVSILLAVALLGSFAGLFLLRDLPAQLRRAMALAVATGVVNSGFYFYYVYFLSEALPLSSEAPTVGEEAVDFAIVAPDGREWRLSSFRGHPVLLVFFRGFW